MRGPSRSARAWGALALGALLLLLGGAEGAAAYEWRGIQARRSSARDAKRVLGEPTQEYRDQLLFANVPMNPGAAPGERIRAETAVLHVGPSGIIESIFLFPEWGTTDEAIRRLFGTGKRTSYGDFLRTMGTVRVGAGTRVEEKLHYLSLDAPCEVYPEARILVVYDTRDISAGNFLVRLILFY